MSDFKSVTSQNYGTNSAFADAVQRAHQIAAEIHSGAETTCRKRTLEDVQATIGLPDKKKMAISDEKGIVVQKETTVNPVETKIPEDKTVVQEVNLETFPDNLERPSDYEELRKQSPLYAHKRHLRQELNSSPSSLLCDNPDIPCVTLAPAAPPISSAKSDKSESSTDSRSDRLSLRSSSLSLYNLQESIPKASSSDKISKIERPELLQQNKQPLLMQNMPSNSENLLYSHSSLSKSKDNDLPNFGNSVSQPPVLLKDSKISSKSHINEKSQKYDQRSSSADYQRSSTRKDEMPHVSKDSRYGSQREFRFNEQRDPKRDNFKDSGYDESCGIGGAKNPMFDNSRDPKPSKSSDPKYDNNRDPRYDNNRDPRYDNNRDPRYDNNRDPRYDNNRDPRYDNNRDPRYDNNRDPRYDNTKDPRYNNSRDPRYENNRDPRYDNNRDPRYDRDPRYEGGKESRYNNPRDPKDSRQRFADQKYYSYDDRQYFSDRESSRPSSRNSARDEYPYQSRTDDYPYQPNRGDPRHNEYPPRPSSRMSESDLSRKTGQYEDYYRQGYNQYQPEAYPRDQRVSGPYQRPQQKDSSPFAMSERLVECLIDIIVMYDVFRFLDILKRFKCLIETQADASFNTSEELNTDASNILNDLKSLCDPPEDVVKYVIGKHVLDKSKQQKGELTEGFADALEKETLNDVRAQRKFKPDHFPENPLKKECCDIQKLQTGPKQRLTNEFSKNLTGAKIVDTSERLVHHSDVFLENDIEKISLLTPTWSSDIYPKMIGQKFIKIFKLSDLNREKFLEAFLRLCQMRYQRVDLRKQLEKTTEVTAIAISLCSAYLRFDYWVSDYGFLKALEIGMGITNIDIFTKAEDILLLIYRIGEAHAYFPTFHKFIIGTLIKVAINSIRNYIHSVALVYSDRSYDSIIQEKISLELILSDYLKYSFPLKKKSISSESQKIDECILLLSKIKKEYCFDPEAWEP